MWLQPVVQTFAMGRQQDPWVKCHKNSLGHVENVLCNAHKPCLEYP